MGLGTIGLLYAEISEDDIYYAYEGTITTERINGILEDIESKFTDYKDLSDNSALRKKIYNIAVESLQNLYHHSNDAPDDQSGCAGKKFGMFIVSRKDDKVMITTGNYIASTKVPFLREKIEKINSLSVDELKEMYKFILNFQKLSPKGGGGLGFIDMARKSGQKFGYRFFPYNDDYQFYRLDIFLTI
jgi:hypothetical protein